MARAAWLISCVIAISIPIAGLPGGPTFTPEEAIALLPTGLTPVDVMGLRASPRMVDLTKKYKEAVQKAPDWWLSHVRKAKAGEPLPYDARMGLTKDEYAEFQRLGKDMRFARERASALKISRSGSRIRFETGDDLPDLNGLEFDPQTNSIRTPYGVADKRSRISASERQSATGPWEGVQWSLEKLDERLGSGTSVKFAVGRMKATGRGIIHFDVRHVRENRKRASYLLLFDPPSVKNSESKVRSGD